MSATHDFTQAFAARSRRFAQAARRRGAQPASTQRSSAPAWLRAVVRRLPDGAQSALRDALDVGAELAESEQRLARRRGHLRDRESALEQAGRDLDRAQRALEERRIELDAKASAAERALAEARRLADEAGTERRVPLAAVGFDPREAPRPVRDVARLAANIKRFGQLTPVVVRPSDHGLQLVTGYRRMAALQVAGFTHVVVRIIPDLDDATAAALYVAENCLQGGVSSNAVRRLAERLQGAPGFSTILPLVVADDEEAVEEVYVEDMSREAHQNLAEGAAWIAALRPYWGDLDAAERGGLEDLLTYFAKVAQRLR